MTRRIAGRWDFGGEAADGGGSDVDAGLRGVMAGKTAREGESARNGKKREGDGQGGGSIVSAVGLDQDSNPECSTDLLYVCGSTIDTILGRCR